MVISEQGEKLLRNHIGKYFELKEESTGPPKQCLGGSMRNVELANGAKAWAFSSSQYVQAAVKNVETYLLKNRNGKWGNPEVNNNPDLIYPFT